MLMPNFYHTYYYQWFSTMLVLIIVIFEVQLIKLTIDVLLIK